MSLKGGGKKKKHAFCDGRKGKHGYSFPRKKGKDALRLGGREKKRGGGVAGWRRKRISSTAREKKGRGPLSLLREKKIPYAREGRNRPSRIGGKLFCAKGSFRVSQVKLKGGSFISQGRGGKIEII